MVSLLGKLHTAGSLCGSGDSKSCSRLGPDCVLVEVDERQTAALSVGF